MNTPTVEQMRTELINNNCKCFTPEFLAMSDDQIKAGYKELQSTLDWEHKDNRDSWGWRMENLGENNL